MNDRATVDRAFAEKVWIRCSRDVLYWTNTCLWTFDPRPHQPTPYLPFISWGFQDEVILEHQVALAEGYDLLEEKTRDMGCSWMPLINFLHGFMFHRGREYLVGSRKEEYVYKVGDKKTLFWKILFLLTNQPEWMIPSYRLAKLILENLETNSTITGESANQDFGRGDRKAGVLLDEFPACEHGAAVLAATDDTTDCRFLVGTPKGTNNEAYRVRCNNNVKRLSIHWSLHPTKAEGLYRVKMVKDDDGERAEVEILDHDYYFEHPGYEFVMEPGGFDGLRSPWYDAQCKRRSKLRVAQELDIDYHASGGQFADPAVIERLCQDTAQRPICEGELNFDSETFQPMGFRRMRGGNLKMWIFDEPEPNDAYNVGADIAMGTGASNSVLTVTNKYTKHQVAEFVCPTIKPGKLGEYAVALARFFNGATLIWEANGPGREFGDRVMEIGYRNIYYRQKTDSVDKKESSIPGWWSTADSKRTLLSEYFRAIEAGEFIVRSEDALRECLDFIITATGIMHSNERNEEDPSGAKSNHADRCIATALCWWEMRAAPTRTEVDEENPPVNSFAWRSKQRRLAREEALSTW